MKSIAHMQATTGAHSEQRAARLALAALSLSMLLSALGTSIANVALPTLAQSVPCCLLALAGATCRRRWSPTS